MTPRDLPLDAGMILAVASAYTVGKTIPLARWAATISLAACIIHAMVLPTHWSEMPQHGIFMLCAVVGQGLGVLWLPLAEQPRWRWVLPATIAGNLLILVIALWAYTVGLPPWLYGDGVEAWNWQVAACDGLELALIVLCLWRWTSPARSA